MDKLVGWGWGDIRESQVEEWACKKAFPHLYSQRYGFSSSYGMRELDHKESWVLKNWCFQTMVLDKTLENPLDSKEIKPVNSKGNQPWIFIGRTDAEAEAPRLWPPDGKSQLNGKDPDAGKDWGQKEKGTTDGSKLDLLTDPTDGWMASLTQWTWVWANSGSQWRTGKPGVLQFIRLKRVRHDLATEQQPTTLCRYSPTSTASPSLKTALNSGPPWFHQDTQPHLNLFSCMLQVVEWMETDLGTISHQHLKHLPWWMFPWDQ